MLLSNGYKFIFIHPHRTGGTALTSELKSHFSSALKESSQHDNAKTDEAGFLANNKNYTVLGTVRNPWERILSWFLILNNFNRKTVEEEKEHFEVFLRSGVLENPSDLYFHYNQLDYFINKEGELLCQDFIRFENYEQSLHSVLKKLNLSIPSPKRLNQSLSSDHKPFYSKISEDIIREKCKKDIEYFGYSF